MPLPRGRLSPTGEGCGGGAPPDELNGLMHLNICMWAVRASSSNDKLFQLEEGRRAVGQRGRGEVEVVILGDNRQCTVDATQFTHIK